MVYVFRVMKLGAVKEEIEEIAAPNEWIAIMILATNDPGIHIIEPMGSYVEGSKGEA